MRSLENPKGRPQLENTDQQREERIHRLNQNDDILKRLASKKKDETHYINLSTRDKTIILMDSLFMRSITTKDEKEDFLTKKEKNELLDNATVYKGSSPFGILSKEAQERSIENYTELERTPHLNESPSERFNAFCQYEIAEEKYQVIATSNDYRAIPSQEREKLLKIYKTIQSDKTIKQTITDINQAAQQLEELTKKQETSIEAHKQIFEQDIMFISEAWHKEALTLEEGREWSSQGALDSQERQQLVQKVIKKMTSKRHKDEEITLLFNGLSKYEELKDTALAFLKNNYYKLYGISEEFKDITQSNNEYSGKDKHSRDKLIGHTKGYISEIDKLNSNCKWLSNFIRISYYKDKLQNLGAIPYQGLVDLGNDTYDLRNNIDTFTHKKRNIDTFIKGIRNIRLIRESIVQIGNETQNNELQDMVSRIKASSTILIDQFGSMFEYNSKYNAETIKENLKTFSHYIYKEIKIRDKEESQQKRDIIDNNRTFLTTKGTKIQGDLLFMHPEFSLSRPTSIEHERGKLDTQDLLDKVTVKKYGYRCAFFNCFSYTFTRGKIGWLGPDKVPVILRENNFKKRDLSKSSYQVGDVALYHIYVHKKNERPISPTESQNLPEPDWRDYLEKNPGEHQCVEFDVTESIKVQLTHAAEILSAKDNKCFIGKWTADGIIQHEMNDVPEDYGKNCTFYYPENKEDRFIKPTTPHYTRDAKVLQTDIYDGKLVEAFDQITEQFGASVHRIKTHLDKHPNDTLPSTGLTKKTIDKLITDTYKQIEKRQFKLRPKDINKLKDTINKIMKISETLDPPLPLSSEQLGYHRDYFDYYYSQHSPESESDSE